MIRLHTTEPLLSAIAAIVYDSHQRCDECLDAFIKGLRREGYKVAGLMSRRGERDDHCSLWVEDLSTGRLLSMSLEVCGEGSSVVKSCALDTALLADAAMVLRQSIDAKPDILVISKFGEQEASGEGFLAELGLAIVNDIPVLTTVRPRWLPALQQFAEDALTVVPRDVAALRQWFDAVSKHREDHSGS